MVHNGIEYGDMQLICEAYQLMKAGLGLDNEEMSRVFRQWNQTELCSYLIEITGDIFGYRDEAGEYVLDQILDAARAEGNRKMDGHSGPGGGGSAYADRRGGVCEMSVCEKGRARGGIKNLSAPEAFFTGDEQAMIEKIKDALFASKIISYTQGYDLMRTAAGTYGWNLNYGGIALMWRGGCYYPERFPEPDKRGL